MFGIPKYLLQSLWKPMEQLAMARVADGSQSEGVLSPAAWDPPLGAGGRNQPWISDGGLAHTLLCHLWAPMLPSYSLLTIISLLPLAVTTGQIAKFWQGFSVSK